MTTQSSSVIVYHSPLGSESQQILFDMMIFRYYVEKEIYSFHFKMSVIVLIIYQNLLKAIRSLNENIELKVQRSNEEK